MTSHTLVGGQALSNVHDEDKCLGEFCCIHRPSDHPMVEWRQLWLGGVMYRISDGGDIYPDPDHPAPPESPNALRCLGCDKVIVSLHRHDYRTCGCPYDCMVDGGNDYQRRGWKDGDPDDRFVDIEDWPIREEWLS